MNANAFKGACPLSFLRRSRSVCQQDAGVPLVKHISAQLLNLN